MSKVGVAISTTGSRPDMLKQAQAAWAETDLFPIFTQYDNDIRGRDGVAATKNQGIAMLMDAGCEHLFLADDDMGPLSKFSWTRYVDDPALHLSLCWGRARLLSRANGYATYSHPRGVLLYLHRSVVERVGGMRPEYGPGGDEHVEYSRRIHQAGLTPEPYVDLDHRASDWFWAADMPLPNETISQFRLRKRRHSTIRRTTRDNARLRELWERFDGDTSFVEYRS